MDLLLVNLDSERRIYGRSLLSYSPGTSSCGTSCAVTSDLSASGASSTPLMIPASNACPSSSSSSALSESAFSTARESSGSAEEPFLPDTQPRVLHFRQC